MALIRIALCVEKPLFTVGALTVSGGMAHAHYLLGELLLG